MECQKCELWKQHKDKAGKDLPKGTCLNHMFSGQLLGSPQITSPNVRCSVGIEKDRNGYSEDC